MGIEPFLISSSLAGILAQRLVRLVCSECREETKPGEGLLEMLGLENREQELVFYRGVGCSTCKGTGYKGRMGIYEVLIVDNELRELISRESSSSVLRTAAVSAGMISMREDGLEKALEGTTSLEEVLRVTGSQ
jgi:type II secretory ATPase GspE/PulE/Tfp pilus assembly ATPase PilB-like protein